MKIGIVGTQNKTVFGVSSKYMEWANQFGDVVILSPHAEYDESIDLLVMQGGADVAPIEGEATMYNLSMSNPYLEYFDKNILSLYIGRKTPIFGICRGLQALNVAFSGTLKNIHNHLTNGDDRSVLIHDLFIDGKNIGGVNSLHHQAVNKLGNGLEVLAHDDGEAEGIIEAFKHETLPIRAVQYHPEEIYDEYSVELVKEII